MLPAHTSSSIKLLKANDDYRLPATITEIQNLFTNPDAFLPSDSTTYFAVQKQDKSFVRIREVQPRIEFSFDDIIESFKILGGHSKEQNIPDLQL